MTHRMPIATASTQKGQQLSVQVSASTPPWLSSKAADADEPFLHSARTSRSIKRSSGMSPAPMKRRKANPDSQISPSRDVQASSDHKQSKLTCSSKLKQQEAGHCFTPRRSSGLRSLPIIPPVAVTDTHSMLRHRQGFQLHTSKQSTAQEAPKLATQQQALQPSPETSGVNCKQPNSSSRSEANLTQSLSLLQPQTWSQTQSQMSWQSPTQTRVQALRMPLVSPITSLDTLPCMYQPVALVNVHLFLHHPTPHRAPPPTPPHHQSPHIDTRFWPHQSLSPWALNPAGWSLTL